MIEILIAILIGVSNPNDYRNAIYETRILDCQHFVWRREQIEALNKGVNLNDGSLYEQQWFNEQIKQACDNEVRKWQVNI